MRCIAAIITIILFIFCPKHSSSGTWNWTTPTYELSRVEVRSYSYDDFEVLSRIINAEAANQPFEGMLAVGNVITNRSENRGKTIKEVVYRKGQFDGLRTRHYKRTKKSDLAAHMILTGHRIFPRGVEYFLNPDISTDTGWKDYILQFSYRRIGDHVFCFGFEPSV